MPDRWCVSVIGPLRPFSPSQLVAIPAFLLALASVGWQAAGYFYGAEVRMYPPDLVELGCKGYDLAKRTCPEGSSLFIRASAIAFQNHGRERYHAVVRSEHVKLTLIGRDAQVLKKIRLEWQYFTNRTDINVEKTAVVPILLPGGRVASHELEFYPRINSRAPPEDQKANFYPWFDLVDLILKEGPGGLAEIQFDFHAEIIGDEVDFPKTCVFIVDSIAVSSFQRNRTGIGVVPRTCYKREGP